MIVRLAPTGSFSVISRTSHTNEPTLTRCPPPAQSVEDTLAGRWDAYSRTLEAGRHLYDSVEDLELQKRLQAELQDLEKAWKEAQSRLARGRELVQAGAQVRHGPNVQNDRSHQRKERLRQLPAPPRGSEAATFSNETPSLREKWKNG